jgi:hypothetical protein
MTEKEKKKEKKSLEELLKERMKVLEKYKDVIKGQSVTGAEVKEFVRKKPRSKKSLRNYIGKEIKITQIDFEGNKAIIKFEVDGKEETAETSDQFVIKRWLIDYKAALDLGAESVRVKVKDRGKYGIAFK